jgi:hypothetical protein
LVCFTKISFFTNFAVINSCLSLTSVVPAAPHGAP